MASIAPITPGMPSAAPSIPRTSRRDVLAAAGFSGLAAVAAAGFARPDIAETDQGAPSSQDAELVGLIGQFNAIEREIATICAERMVDASRDDWEPDLPEGDASSAKVDVLFDKKKPLFRQIESTRARTVEGLQARALMLQSWDDELAKEGFSGGFVHDRMIKCLVRDLINLPA